MLNFNRSYCGELSRLSIFQVNRKVKLFLLRIYVFVLKTRITAEVSMTWWINLRLCFYGVAFTETFPRFFLFYFFFKSGPLKIRPLTINFCIFSFDYRLIFKFKSKMTTSILEFSHITPTSSFKSSNNIFKFIDPFHRGQILLFNCKLIKFYSNELSILSWILDKLISTFLALTFYEIL